MYLIIDAHSILSQFLHIKDEEYGRDIIVDGVKFHIPDLETCKERAEENFHHTIDKLNIDPQKIIMVCESPEPGAARKRKYPDYKAGRQKRPKQYYEVLNGLVEHMKELVMTSGGIVATPKVVPSVEADDLVCELCKRLPETTVWSTDKDYFAYSATHHYIGGVLDNSPFPVPNDLIILYRAIVTGDASDNLPSAKGFGEKAWEEMLSVFGPEGIYALKELVENRELHRLEEDLEYFPKLRKIIDSAESVYLAYEMMSPIPVPSYKVKWEARCQECSKELVTASNFDRVYDCISKLNFDHSVIDFETDTPTESDAWKEQTKNDDDKGGVGVDVIASEITGMGLKIGTQTWYFSVDHKDTDNITLDQLESVIQLIKGKRTYAHNSAGFESVVLYNTFGYFLEEILDTRLMASYVNENDYMGLKHLSKRDLGYTQTTYEEVMAGRRGMRELSGAEVFDYGIDDVITCDSLQNLYTVIMLYEGSYDTFLALEQYSAHVTSLAFAEGIEFDKEAYDKLKTENDNNIKQAEEELSQMLIDIEFGEDAVYRPLPETVIKSSIMRLFETVTGERFESKARTTKGCIQWLRDAGYGWIADVVEAGHKEMNILYKKHWVPRGTLNVRSPKQTAELLYGTLHCPVRIRNKVTEIMRRKGITEGNPSTNDEAITNAIAFGDVDGVGKATLEKLLEYKGYLTRESLFLSKYPKFVHWKTGRIHSAMMQSGTTTRRFSHNAPNLAQLPKKKGREVRNLLKAGDGFLILANDFSSQELKLQAEDSKCSEFMACYTGEVKQDVHSKTGYQVAIMQGVDPGSYAEFEARVTNGDPEAEKFRAEGKATNFSTAYLCKARRLANMLAIPLETGQAFIDAKDKAFPGLMPHIEKFTRLCRKQKYSKTFMGARRHLEKQYAMARTEQEVEAVDRLAWSYRIQSSAAEQIKLAMSRLWLSGIYKTGRVFPVTIIHDEIVNRIREDSLQDIKTITDIICDNYADMVIKAESAPEVGKNFGSLNKYVEESK